MNRALKWVNKELKHDADLAARVDTDLTRLRVKQDLIRLREEQGLSQRDLARRVAVSQPVIARIEAGTAQNLQLRTLLKIASALNGQADITIRPRRRKGHLTKRVSGRLVRFRTLSGAFLTRVEVAIERRAVDTQLLRYLTC